MRGDIRKLAEKQPLPEYGLRIDRDGKHELVTLYRDHGKPRRLPRGFKRLAIEGGKRLKRPLLPADAAASPALLVLLLAPDASRFARSRPDLRRMVKRLPVRRRLV